MRLDEYGKYIHVTIRAVHGVGHVAAKWKELEILPLTRDNYSKALEMIQGYSDSMLFFSHNDEIPVIINYHPNSIMILDLADQTRPIAQNPSYEEILEYLEASNENK